MCFSATASFAASAVLIPTGLYTARRAMSMNVRYAPFAAFPLAFGVQQVFEGMVWLSLGGREILDEQAAALGFTFFSHFFWLVWVPFSTWTLEPSTQRKRVSLFLTLIGGFYGLSLYLPLHLYEGWLRVVPVQGSIEYEARLIYDGMVSRIGVRAFYAVLIVAPMLVCSERSIRVFGALIAVSVVVTVYFFSYAFISVWCYFAAIGSLFLAFAIKNQFRI